MLGETTHLPGTFLGSRPVAVAIALAASERTGNPSRLSSSAKKRE